MVEQLTENQRVRSSILRSGISLPMNINFFDLKKLFDTGYIFESAPSAEGLYKYLAILFGLFIIFAFALIIKSKKQNEVLKKLYSKAINLLLLGGFFGLILVFFRWQGIPYLSSRLLLLVLFLIFLLWLLRIMWYKFKILPKEIEQYNKRKIFEKYLP